MRASLTIHPLTEGVRLEGHALTVEADTSWHTLRLFARRGRAVELASSRQGIETAVRRLVRAIGLEKARDVRAPAAPQPPPQRDLFAAAS